MPSRIMGHVLDDGHRPVGKVRVSFQGKQVAESGTDGFFSVALKGAASRVALTFHADGHVPNTRVYNARATGINVVVIWPVAYRVHFNPARDLEIELGSSRIQIPAGALAGPARGKLNGRAGLRFTLFDVTSAQQRLAAPGDFSGRLSDGGIRRLNSYGIFDFGVEDARGRPLSLRRGASIDLSIPVPRTLAGNAPRQVGFFNFDPSPGLWNQIGTWELVPDTLTYNGSVTSFGGAHNLDDPQDTVCVTIQVKDVYGNPIANANVTAHGAQYDSTGVTDAGGFVCLLVQRNASFHVTASGMSGSTYYSSYPWIQYNFTSPNFSSGTSDCGDPALCPFLGVVPVDYIVGTGGPHLPGSAGRPENPAARRA